LTGDASHPDAASRIASGVLTGEIRDLARAITLVENGTERGRAILRTLFPRTGRASVVGITGFPGTGKSSLVDQLTSAYRSVGKKVGVVAVDPSSAFSGGAILGDRIRMQRHATDSRVFIRSLATRGNFGGLSKATRDVVDLVDAAGYDPILLETVGVGQDEIEVIEAADTIAVVLVPGLGDDIQAIKAGILEIADLFVINKSDHPGAERLEKELTGMLSLGGKAGTIPILRTVAVRGEGIEELCDQLTELQALARKDGSAEERRRKRSKDRFLALLRDRLVEKALDRLGAGNTFGEVVDGIHARQIDPHAAVDRVLADLNLSDDS
jgi:GTPase